MTSPLSDVIADVARLPKEIIDSAVERFDELAVESAAQVIGHGGVMNIRTPRGPRPTPLRTKPQFTRQGVIVGAIVRGKPVGPWVWIEDGTTAHDIAPRKGRGKRRRALGGPSMDHPVSGPVRHLGSTGRQAWSRAAAAMEFEIDGLVDTELRELLRG